MPSNPVTNEAPHQKSARALPALARAGPIHHEVDHLRAEARNRVPEIKGQAMSEQLVTVCDRCLCASCWQGIFYCDDYKVAGTTQKTKTELRKLKREHPSYWKTDRELIDR
jgi:hypothetical protein